MQDGPSPILGHCGELLKSMHVEGHSRFELGAVCRSRLPPEVCRSALGPLRGNAPWSTETISETCSRWEAEWQAHTAHLVPSRRAQTATNLVETLNLAMQKKRELGICQNLAFDECARMKAEKYPALIANASRILQEIFTAFMNKRQAVLASTSVPSAIMPGVTVIVPGMGVVSPSMQAKYEEWKGLLAGLVVPRHVGLCVGLLALSFAAATVATCARRARRHGAYRSVEAWVGDELVAEALQPEAAPAQQPAARPPKMRPAAVWLPFGEQGIMAS